MTGEPLVPAVDALVPAVDPLDLQRVFTTMRTIHEQAPGQQSGAIDIGIYKKLCGPGADVNAVWYRASMLLMVLCHGPLAGKRGDLDEKVFRIAAKFPMKRMEPGVPQRGLPFDVNEFLKQLSSDESTR
jgi:hypothetical protein